MINRFKHRMEIGEWENRYQPIFEVPIGPIGPGYAQSQINLMSRWKSLWDIVIYSRATTSFPIPCHQIQLQPAEPLLCLKYV